MNNIAKRSGRIEREDGTYINVADVIDGATDGNNFVSVNNFEEQVVRGNVPGVSVINKFGRDADISTTSQVVATSGVYRTPTALTSLEIISDSVDDDPTSTGAHTIIVEGVGDGWTFQSEEVTLNGTTAVALSNDWYRVSRIYVSSSGTYADPNDGSSHAGRLTLQESGAGNIWAAIDGDALRRGESEIAAYTVPLGQTAYIKRLNVSVDSNKVSDVIFFARRNAHDVTSPFTGVQRVQIEFNGINAGISRAYDYPLGPYEGACDIWVEAFVDSGTAEVSANFELVIYDD